MQFTRTQQNGRTVGWGYAAKQAATGAIPADRVDFLKKVYTYFLFSIVASGIGGWFGLQNMQIFSTIGYWPIIIAEFALLILCFVFQRTQGLNLLLLGGFTFVSGLTIAPTLMASIVSTGSAAIIQQAYIATLLVFGSLTGYVIMSKKDFSYLGGFLFIALIGLLISGLMMMFFGGSVAHMVYSWATLVIFCGFVLFDTSRILYHYQDGDEVGAAIGIYLDCVNIFLAILSIMSKRD
jgi:modulator of FtsH protease